MNIKQQSRIRDTHYTRTFFIKAFLRPIYGSLRIKIVRLTRERGTTGGAEESTVNIAIDLFGRPQRLYFYDEPTSGLSSVDAKIAMDILKGLSVLERCHIDNPT